MTLRTGCFFLLLMAVTSLSGQKVTRSGIHPEDMDLTCKPCTDFWQYVNGGWIEKNPIPAAYSTWGTMSVLAEANVERTRTILDAAVADKTAKAGTNQRKMADLYNSCLNTTAIDARGVQPLSADLDRIRKIQSREDLVAYMAEQQTTGRDSALFRLGSAQDRKDPTSVIATIGAQGIFSLPDRDYFLKDDARSREIRDEFLRYAAKLLQLAGEPTESGAQQARLVLNLETEMAKAVMTIAQRRDPDSTYHPMDVAALKALAPNFDWALLLKDAGVPPSTRLNVSEPEAVKKFNELLASTAVEDWKVWLRWRTLRSAAPTLAKPLAEESFHFESTVLSGVKEQLPRWQICARVVDRDLGDALGQAWVEKYFPAEAKKRMLELVENLRAAMREKLEQSEWMTAATKKNAIEKLNALHIKIGYTDKWRDYSSLSIDPNTYFENARAARRHAQQFTLARIGKPLDRTEWTMTPPTVNAYSSSGQVEVVFPAGILQPPFFDLAGDDAANYGAIGAVIGHEMGHQFDDGGSKFDATGAQRNWWTEDDRKRFDARTGCVVEQFNATDVPDGKGNILHHVGKQVLGEALGDLGGLTIAYRAYQRSLAGKTAPAIDGYTGDQRFFIAFAHVWGSAYRPEALRLRLTTDPHPAPKYRADLTLMNMPEFHKAFQCVDGDPMVRPAAQQCKLW